MKRVVWRLIFLFFACGGFSFSFAQNTCVLPVDIAVLPYASPNHTTGTILTPNQGYSTCGTGNDFNPFAVCGVAGANREDAVFTYTPTAANSCITLTLSGSNLAPAPLLNPSAALFVFDNCPSAVGVSCVASVVNNGAAAVTLTNVILNPGVTYYIVIDGGNACFPYKLTVVNGSCAVPPPTGEPGSNCSNSINIGFPYVRTDVSAGGMGIDYVGGCVLPNNGGEDVFYHFTVANTKCIRYQVQGLNLGAAVYLSLGCPGASGSVCLKSSICRIPYCDGLVEELTLQPGDYYFVVKGDSPYQSLNYDISLESLTADDNVTCQTCNDSDNCAPCKNSGFEKMNLQAWVGGYGMYNTPGQAPGFAAGVMNDGMTRHTLVSRGHYDTLINVLPVVPPNGGDFAVRLGNCNNGYQAEQLSYSIVVDSNNTNFIYQYAVVLEYPTPEHSTTNRPYFSIKMNVDGQNISCAEYIVYADTNIQGFLYGGMSPGNPGTAPGSVAQTTQSPMYYKNWTTVNIPLLDFIGQTATITFTTKDCNQGGHFGYAYLDAKCERLEILKDNNLYCKEDTIVLTAPAGFASYQWSNGATTQVTKVWKKGTYVVTCTTVTGCVIVLTNEIKMELPPIPNFSSAFDCKDSVVTFTDASTLQNGAPISRWEWSFGDGDSAFVQNPSHKYTSSGNFNVTLRLYTASGCTADTLIVLPIDVYMPQGFPNALDTIKLCEKALLQLKADSIGLTTYEWTGANGFSSNLINPKKSSVALADSGWYRLKVVIKDCITKFDSTYVVIEPLKKPFIAADTIICSGDTAHLYGGGGASLLWSPPQGLSGITIPNPLAYPDTSTIYTLTLFNDLCPDTALTVQVRVLSGTVSMQMPDTFRVCPNDVVKLVASLNGFDTFKWTGPNGFKSTIANPVVTNLDSFKVGYYYLACSISTNNCLVGKDSTWVDLWPNPIVVTSPDTTVLCVGDSALLHASGAATYLWSPAQFLSSIMAQNPMVKPLSNKTYLVTGTSVNGCKGIDSLTVQVNPLPKPTLGKDLLFCLGDTSYFVFTNSYDSLRWTTGVTTDSILVTATDTVGVKVWEKGCAGLDTVSFLFQDPGSFSLGSDTLLCMGLKYGTNISLTADSVLWMDKVRTLNRLIDTAGTYSVRIWSGKCEYTDTIAVFFDSPPVAKLAPDSIICIGDSVILHAHHPNALSYLWNTGSTDSVITVYQQGVYKVELRSARCISADSVFVTVVQPPKLDLGPDKVICDKDSVQFVANINGADKYVWNTQETTPAIWVKTAGHYDLTVSYGPCTLYDTAELVVQFPVPFNLPADTTLCEDQWLEVKGPAGFDSYLWSSGEQSKNIWPIVSGSFSLAATSGLCTSYDTIVVKFDTIPHFELPPGPVLCQGSSVLIYAPLNASNYSWTTGETTPSIRIADEGYYGLTITNGQCSFYDSLFLKIVIPPPVEIGPDQTVCIGTGVTYGDSVPMATYLWSSGETSAFITKYAANKYSVKVFYDVCVIKDTARLEVSLKPDPNLGADQLVCEDATIPLFANTFGDSFLWNTNSTLDNAVVNQAGTYWVRVTNGPCVSSDTITITFQPKHRVILPEDVSFCSGAYFDITSLTDAQYPKYRWNTGVTTEKIRVKTTGEYALTVTNGACVASDTIAIIVHPLPIVAPIQLNICPEDSMTVHLPSQYNYFHFRGMAPFLDSVIYPGQDFPIVVYDANGCRWDTRIVSSTDPNCERDIYVPNTFTPNGDGENEVFRVVAYNLELLELSIFDRWGELIFQTNDPAKGWNGFYKGELCKTDVYEWKLTYKNNYGTKKLKFGHVNLLK